MITLTSNTKKILTGIFSFLFSCVFLYYLTSLLSMDSASFLGELSKIFFYDIHPVSKLSALFYFMLLVFWGSLLYYSFLTKHSTIVLPICLLSAFLTIFFIAGFLRSSGSAHIFPAKSIYWNAVLIIVFSFFLYMILISFYDWINHMKKKSHFANIISHPFLISFLILLTLWMPFVLASMPCSICPDSMSQIYDILKGSDIDPANPIFISFLYGKLFALGRSLSGDFLGGFLIVAFQMLLCAYAMSSLTAWVYDYSHSKLAYIFALICFGIIPTWGITIQCILKDVTNLGCFILFILAYADIALDRKKTSKCLIFRLFFWAFLTSITKKFVFVIVIISLICLLIYKHKDKVYRKYMAICIAALSMLIITLNILTACLPFFSEARKVEKYSLPLQQIARYYKEYGNELSDAQKAVINTVIDCEKIDDVYSPDVADGVKSISHIPEDMTPFWKLYFSLLIKKPQVFFSQLIDGYWKFFYPLDVGNSPARWGTPTDYPFLGPDFELHLEHQNYELLMAIQIYYSSWLDHPVLRSVLGPGLYVCTLLSMTGYSILARHKKSLIVYIPLLLVCFGLFFTHVNGENRYAFPIMATMPFFTTIAILDSPNIKE